MASAHSSSPCFHKVSGYLPALILNSYIVLGVPSPPRLDLSASMLVSLLSSILVWIQDGAECKVSSSRDPPDATSSVLIKSEAWGEDKVLTSKMGVAYSAGLSKNNSLAEPDAVVPIMKVCNQAVQLYQNKTHVPFISTLQHTDRLNRDITRHHSWGMATGRFSKIS